MHTERVAPACNIQYVSVSHSADSVIYIATQLPIGCALLAIVIATLIPSYMARFLLNYITINFRIYLKQIDLYVQYKLDHLKFSKVN